MPKFMILEHLAETESQISLETNKWCELWINLTPDWEEIGFWLSTFENVIIGKPLPTATKPYCFRKTWS